MAKTRQKIRPGEITKEHLLQIPGVGTRNIGILTDLFANEDSLAQITVEDLTVPSKISERTAASIYAWVERHVDFEVDEFWENGQAEEEPESVVEETNEEAGILQYLEEGRPLLRLAVDPIEILMAAAKRLHEYDEDDPLIGALGVVAGAMHGRFALN